MPERSGDAWQTWVGNGGSDTYGHLVSAHDDGGVTIQQFVRGDEVARISVTREKWAAIVYATNPIERRAAKGEATDG